MKTIMDKQLFSMLGFSLVICRNKQGQYLAVREGGDRGWWLPGGKVDPPESFQQAAIRETLEEAGVNVQLKGILRTEQKITGPNFQRFKVIFYAEPIDENQLPKQVADSESLEARWVTIPELVELSKEKFGWRGPELYQWATYIESGGQILPLSTFVQEGAEIFQEQSFTIKDLPLNR